jgi:hypothetical protein
VGSGLRVDRREIATESRHFDLSGQMRGVDARVKDICLRLSL